VHRVLGVTASDVHTKTCLDLAIEKAFSLHYLAFLQERGLVPCIWTDVLGLCSKKTSKFSLEFHPQA
jgi:hypothetical protein